MKKDRGQRKTERRSKRKTIPIEIAQTSFIRASPELVYDAFTSASGLDGWFTTGSRVDPRPGGEIRFHWTNSGPDHSSFEDGGPVLEARRPARFVFQWHPDNQSYATTVELGFHPLKNGTVVSVRENGYRNTPSGRKAFMNCATGWGEALTLLKVYLEHVIRLDRSWP